MISKITPLLLLLALATVAQQQQSPQPPIHTLLIHMTDELKDWIEFQDGVVTAATQCNLQAVQDRLLQLHQKLTKTGSEFSRKHIDVIRMFLKDYAEVKDFLKCLTDLSSTENKYLEEKKKYKYLAQFLREYPRLTQDTFQEGDKPEDQGYRLGRFFKAFFEYYYQFVLHPAETISTRLLRYLTTKTDVFEHEDISPCVDLESSGKISDSLQNLGINNIYINIPEAFDAIKFLKLKRTQNCRTPKLLGYVSALTQRISGVDLFKVMYHDYSGFVEIAAEKYGNYQVEAIAAIFADIINSPSRYEKISQLSQGDL